MNQLKPPNELKLAGNVEENWTHFKLRLDLYLIATNSDKKEDKQKIAILLTVAGPDAVEIYNTFEFTEDERDKFQSVIDKFPNYCTPLKNQTYESYIFRSRMMTETESIDEYVTDLKTKVKEKDLNLEKCIELCKISESMASRLKKFQSPEKEVNAVGKKKKYKPKKKHSHQTEPAASSNPYQREERQYRPQTSVPGSRQGQRCKKCGTQHGYGQCPAYRKQCAKCKAFNHFAVMCRSKGRSYNRYYNRNQNVHVVDDVQTESSSSDEDSFVFSINDDSGNKNEWVKPFCINNAVVPFKLDTGAQVNILPRKNYKNMSPRPKLFQRRIVLKAYNGQIIPTAGTCRAKMEHHGRSTMVQFVVTPGEFQPILGVNTCEKLDLVRQIHVINTDVVEEKPTKASTCRVADEFPDVFKGLGCLPIQYKIQLKDNALPVIHPVRKVPSISKKDSERTQQTNRSSQ